MNTHPLQRQMDVLPHRHPMLLIDRIENISLGRQGSAYKLISANEAQLEGATDTSTEAFPGSLLVDALGQLAIAVLARDQGAQPEVWYLASIESMSFTRELRHGELVRMEAEVQRSFGGTSKMSVRAKVNDETAAEGMMVLSNGQRSKQLTDKNHLNGKRG